MMTTTSVVQLSHLLATALFKTSKSFKESQVGRTLCILCCRIKHENILISFQAINQKPIDWKRKSKKIIIIISGFWPTKMSSLNYLNLDLILTTGTLLALIQS